MEYMLSDLASLANSVVKMLVTCGIVNVYE